MGLKKRTLFINQDLIQMDLEPCANQFPSSGHNSTVGWGALQFIEQEPQTNSRAQHDFSYDFNSNQYDLDSAIREIDNYFHNNKDRPNQSELDFKSNHQIREALSQGQSGQEEKPYTCGKCDFICYQYDDLEQHVRGYHVEDLIKTEDNEKAEHYISFEDASMDHEEKPFICVSCDYVCAIAEDLEDHKNVCPSNRKEKIPYNNDNEDNSSQNSENNEASDSDEETSDHSDVKPEIKIFKCEICPYSSRISASLKQHMKCHSTQKPYACDLCDFRSNYKGSYTIHMKTHTGNRPIRCDIIPSCPFRFMSITDLEKHRRTHTGEKPFKCEICDFRSARSSDVKRHTRIHTGETPFKCELCSFKCKNSGDLKVHHRRVHTGEKPYSCLVCGYRNAHLGHLKDHIQRYHVKIKPFQCESCGFTSFNKGRLRLHIINNHLPNKLKRTVKRFQCDFCTFSCTKLIHLDSHTLKVHNKEKHSHKCKNCDFTTINSYLLTRHVKKHCKPL